MTGEPKPLWHEIKFEDAQLNIEQDAAWLNDVSDKDITTDLLVKANQLVARGSIDLHFETDPETVQSVMQARHEFYGQVLGWDEPDHLLHEGYLANQSFTIRTLPLATFIMTQRVLADAGVNNAKVLRRFHEVAYLAPQAVAEKITNLEALGLHPVSVINNYPAVIGLAPVTVRKKVEGLAEFGLTSSGAISRAPSLIGSSTEKLRANHDALKELGLDMAKMPNMIPSLLYGNPAAARAKMALLKANGLDAGKLVSVFPNILALSEDNIMNRLFYFGELGLNVQKIITREPTLFGLAAQSLDEKISLLKSNGIDVVKVLNNCPSILRVSPGSLLARLDNMRDLGMDPAVVINKQPSSMSLATETLQRKIRLFNSLLKTFGSEHTAGGLIEVFPAALTRSPKKVLATARFVADHGTKETIPDTVNSAATLLVRPLLNMLIVASSEEVFSVSAVAATKTVPDERSQIEHDILTDKEKVVLVGAKCIRLYKAAQKLGV